MKKILLMFIAIVFVINSFSQTCPPPDPTFNTTDFTIRQSGTSSSVFSGGCWNFGNGTDGGCSMVQGNASTQISSFSCGFCYEFTVGFDISGDVTAPLTADGFTFSFLEMPSDSKGCSASSSWSPGCNNGGNLGYIGTFNNGTGPAGTKEAILTIEIDLFSGNTGDPACANNHITIVQTTSTGDSFTGAQNYCFIDNLEDGGPDTIRICWDPSADAVTVLINGNLRATYSIDLEALFGSPSCVFPYFTTAWEPGNTASICGITVLDAAILNFTAKLNNSKIDLTWDNPEDLNAVYEVQRSNDGKNFITIATIQSLQGLDKYMYEDLNPQTGNNYYRLKERNLYTNVETASSIKVVNFNQNSLFDINVFGNAVYVNVKSKAQKNYTLKIFDVSGKVLAHQDYFESSETQLKNLSSGMYIINLISDGENITKKVIISNE
jgi:hypothetical protein